ncbi:J domain-containing protein required for chloroplast accumulation response 1-like [Durio zibethinus]|uniref:J domain-containing protein required for chloroplast accumulation response 1-like n=1 Tax=Durio zibethinus TaxID=66656 RepID=A0A6P6B7A0_DURZI|nr:J domain-containing protein required for chloroplast accumulation response 1-like [Durio zibethinus]
MQRFSQRESTLSGYSPQKTSMDSSSAPKTPDRNSDIDFNDVFGGPPRRSSIQEARYSFGENTDSSSAFRRSDETVVASRNPWSGLSEKPVFGEEGMSRRRYSRNDFFDDIFGGNESLRSSPRRYEMRDPFAADSQLLSPAGPLPPKAEPFGSSFPAQFSLPAKLNKGMDLPTFGSPTCSTSKSKDGFSNGSSHYAHSPLSRVSGQANQDKEEVRNDFQSSYGISALSQELSTGTEESTNLTKNDETETKGNPEEDSSSSETLKNGSHFHFSIYKWANKGGVPLAIPLRRSDRLKEKDKLQRCSSGNGWIACENIATEPKSKLQNSFISTDRMSSNSKSFRAEHDKNEHGSLIDSINEDGVKGQIIDEDSIPKSETEIISRLKSTEKNVPNNTVSHGSGGEEKTRYTLSQKDLCDKREKEVSTVAKETQKPKPKLLNLLFNDDSDDAEANDKMTRNAGRTKDISEKRAKKFYEILDGKNIKKHDVKNRATSNNVEASTTSVKGSPRNSWENGKGKVKGKVKEFIKIFNQDASSKPKADTVTERHSSRRKEGQTVKPENEPSIISMTERDKNIHMPEMQTKKSSSDVPVANHMSNGASDKNTNSSVKDSVSDGSKTILEDPADSFEDNFLIEDLTPEEKMLLQFGIDPEEIQAIDAKIRQWSNGKQGNIRSLLSTLQYVLWPDSGWKPVPLVDIIEGPAVKRSYQKALLCLHPDKLKQKGAASDQKYIAEKVFDILQDAWTHFNSLGSV